MDEILAIYVYPELQETSYFEKDLHTPDAVIKIFDYRQISLAIITKAGWQYLISHHGYEKLFELNIKSDRLDDKSIDEFKQYVDCEMHNAK